jgi:hypothetical protein
MVFFFFLFFCGPVSCGRAPIHIEKKKERKHKSVRLKKKKKRKEKIEKSVKLPFLSSFLSMVP